MPTLITYPIIDRSNFVFHNAKRDEDDHLDMNQEEGVFSDGRPYRAESWAAYYTTYISYYFSMIDMEHCSNQELKAYLISEGAVEFDDEKFSAYGFQGINVCCGQEKDKHGNDFWRITIIVGDDDGTYVKTHHITELSIFRDSKDWTSESDGIFSYLNAVSCSIANSVIKEYMLIESTMMGDESPVENVWQELCIQVQDEQSIFWDVYEMEFGRAIGQELEKLDQKLKDMIWVSIGDNTEYELEERYFEEDIVDHIFSNFICLAAEDYQDTKVLEYLRSQY